MIGVRRDSRAGGRAGRMRDNREGIKGQLLGTDGRRTAGRDGKSGYSHSGILKIESPPGPKGRASSKGI